MSYKIVNLWTPSSKYSIKAPYAMNPNTITVHNTANTASARNEVNYMRNNNNQTSYHVAVDDKEVVQTIPFNRNSWHAGDGANGAGNRRSIGIEICYSMDNGYSGAYSARHRQAEDNAALYIAHVLKQYGWGVDRLRQHYNWTRKDCPHKMRAHNGWNAFKRKVQNHLEKLNGKTARPAAAPKASTSGWKTNRHGTQYLATKGKFTVGSEPITVRVDSPFRSAKTPRTSQVKPGTTITYHELVRQDGHIWIGYRTGQGGLRYLPVRTWNSRTGAVGPAWGTFS